jgi:hypothetical protein
MANQNIMNIGALKRVLNTLGNELGDDYQVWLSSDEEGNEFLPVHDDLRLCLAIEPEKKRIVLFPSHRQPQLPGE